MAHRRSPGWREELIDPWLWGSLALGALLRILPLILWGTRGCMRDECSYRVLARKIVDGHGLVTQDNWLWAPGYPYLLAAHERLFGHTNTVKYLQVGLSVLSIYLLYTVATALIDRRAGRIAAGLMALHPTMAFFAGTLWSETVYTFFLLAAVIGLLWARQGRAWRALVPGVLVGVCVLFRGVATYMAPLFVIALLWPAVGQALGDGLRSRWGHALMVLLAVVVTVAPYSVHATQRHGGFILSDATLGRMLYLGNNDYPPVSFDYGNGKLRNRTLNMDLKQGRPPCSEDLDAAGWDECETDNGKQWIAEHKVEFVRRIPVRVAQLLQPHTFLTRHIRLGKWWRLVWQAKEGIVLWSMVWSFLVIVGGSAAVWVRARGPFGFLAVSIVGYHVAAIALTAGLSRYRLPLEPLWIVFLAGVLSDPAGAWRVVRGSMPRQVGLMVTVPIVLMLTSWFVWTGYPGLLY